MEKVLPNQGYKQIFSSWADLPGYPLVTATANGNLLHVSQKRFLRDEEDHNDKTLYTIPITFATENSESLVPAFYLNSTEHAFVLPNPYKFYILNVQQAGFYRVNYDLENWKNIERALHTTPHKIHVLNRAQIIDDLFNFARAGYHKYNEIMGIVSYLKNEKHYIPWQLFWWIFLNGSVK